MVEIKIPIRLPGLNEVITANRINRYAGAKQKKTIDDTICYFIKTQCKVAFTEPVNISCLWIEKDQRRDKDNISSAIKFIQDSLVKCGVLKNDGWKQINGIYHDFKVDKTPGVIVTLETLSGDARKGKANATHTNTDNVSRRKIYTLRRF